MKKSASLVIISLLALLCFPRLAEAQATRYTVQLEAAPTLNEAQERVKQLKVQKLDAYIVKSEVPGKGTFYRVRVGSFPSPTDARKYGADLQRQGIARDFFIAPFEQPQADLAPPTTVVTNTAPKPTPTPPLTAPPKVAVVEKPTTTTTPKDPQLIAGNSANTPANTPVATPNPAPPPSPAPAPSINYVKFQDQAIGYSFERPQYWEGGALDQKDAQEQKVNAGALFKSYQDSAFIHAIWNNLEKANSPDNDNDLIVELILKSMGSGDDTQQMTETGRRVVSENGVIKTFLDLRATFKVQGQDGPLDFLGKAVIVRANKGILLVSAFYSKNGPPYVPTVADRILASVRPPE